MIKSELSLEEIAEQGVLTAREAASYLGVSQRRIYQLANSPKDKPRLRSIRRYGLRLIFAQDVQMLLKIRETFGRQGGRPKLNNQALGNNSPSIEKT